MGLRSFIVNFNNIIVVVLLIINSAYSTQDITNKQKNYIKKETIYGDNIKQNMSVNSSKSIINDFYQDTLQYYNPEHKAQKIDAKTVYGNSFEQSIPQKFNNNINNNKLTINKFTLEQTYVPEQDGNILQSIYYLCFNNHNLLNDLFNEVQLLKKRIDMLERTSYSNRDQVVRDINIPMSQLINKNNTENSNTINSLNNSITYIKETVDEIYNNLPMNESCNEVYNRERSKYHKKHSKYNKYKKKEDFNIATEI